MEGIEVKPMLLAKLESYSREYARTWAKHKAGLQNIVDQYNAMALPAIANTAELCRLCIDTDAFIFDMQTGGGAIVAGTSGNLMEVDKKQAINLIAKPAGYSHLKAVIAEFTANCTTTAKEHNVTLTTLKDDFSFSDNVLTFSENRKFRLSQAGNVYARTERGQAIFRFIQKVNDALFEEGVAAFTKGHNSIIVPEDISDFLFKIIKGFDTHTKQPILHLGDSAYPSYRGDKENF